MSVRYKILDQTAIYYLTFAVVDWIDVFTRDIYCNILLESLRFCQKEKGLTLHAWCIMPSHVHLIASAKKGFILQDILRDMKKFTAREIIKEVKSNSIESRKEWLLSHFQAAGRGGLMQFWQHDNHPIELFSNKVIDEKIEYIHNNPISGGIIDEPWQYRYSSARDYSGHKGLLQVEILD